jgi:hypothetical protein
MHRLQTSQRGMKFSNTLRVAIANSRSKERPSIGRVMSTGKVLLDLVSELAPKEPYVYMLGAYKRVGRHRPAEARLNPLMRAA